MPRITYWTGQWNPTKEAISKEVALLRGALSPHSPIVSFSNAQRSTCHLRERVVQLSHERWLVLRGLMAVLEPWSDLSHIAGDLSWQYLNVLGRRRPVLYTLMTPFHALPGRFMERVSFYAVETEALGAQLRNDGIEANRVGVVYPGINLDRYRPTPPPEGRFRCVFASTPAHVADFEPRGIPLMIELARRRPDIDLWLPWRQWGDDDASTAALAALNPPPNVFIDRGDVADMSQVYGRAHATICCYAPDHGKSCPNSVVEGLACGRPSIVATTSGLADLLDGTGSGVVVERTVEGLSAAVDALQRDRAGFADRARATAERHFALETFLGAYARLYDTLAKSSGAG